MKRIIFFGTSNFAIPALKYLHTLEGAEVVAVVTKPDEPQGRQQVLMATPVKIAAGELGIRVLVPEKLKDVIPDLQKLKPDLGVVAAYGKILPKQVLDIPREGFLNIHPSLLPRHRGPSPVQSTIASGDALAGVTIIKIDEQMDHGPIVAQETIALDGSEWHEDLKARLAEIGARMLSFTLPNYLAGTIVLMPQNEVKATFCKELTRADGRVDLQTQSAETILRLLRAYSPWPGMWTELKHDKKTLRVKILNATVAQDRLQIISLQPEGGKPMTLQAFQNGYPEFAELLGT